MTKATLLGAVLSAIFASMAPSLADAAAKHWVVDATFADGGTLKGYFNLNSGGYLSTYDLISSANSPFGGFEFKPGGGNIAGSLTSGNTVLTLFGPAYNADQLHLQAAQALDAAGTNSLTTASFECFGSYSCPNLGTVRYLASASALAAPEPGVWTFLLAGFGAAGGSLRRRRLARD